MPNSLHERSYRVLIELVTEARRTRGITQESLAKVLGRSQSFVSKYERGERRIDVTEFFAIADALGVDGLSIIRRWRSEL